MKTLLCAAIVFIVTIWACDWPRLDTERVTVKNPASASDLKNFYRLIQALIGDSILNETAVAVV